MAVRETLELDTRPYDQALEEAVGTTERAGISMGKAFEQAGAGTETLGAGADSLKTKVKDLALGVGGLAAIIGTGLTRRMKGLGGLIRGAVVGSFELASLGALGVARGLRRVAIEAEESESALRVLAPAANAAATGMETVAKVAIRVSAALTGAKIAAAAAAAALAVAANRAAADFVPQWNRVLTLIEGSPVQLRALRAEVSDMAGDFGQKAPEALDAFYNILSAMPQVAQDPRRALDLLGVSLQISSTGFGTAGESASALTAILNAFNIEVERSGEVADKLFATQDRGVTTFGELAGSIGRVAPLVASLNGGLDDTLGIVATLTPTGSDTAQVFTQIRAAITNIIKPSAQASEAAAQLGLDFSAAAVGAKGLSGFLLEVIEAADANPDVLARLFGSTEALALVTALSGQTQLLEQNVEAIGDAAGSTAEKVEQMNKSWERQKEILRSQVRAELEQLGFDFESAGAAGLGFVNDLLKGVRRLQDIAPLPFTRGFVERPVEALEEAERRLFDRSSRREQIEFEKEAVRLGLEGFGVTQKRFTATEQLQRSIKGFIETLRELTSAEEDQADAAAMTLEQRRQAIEFELFGRLPGLPGVSTEDLDRPELPLSVEFSQDRIRELEQARRAQAVVALARTGDEEAFKEALRETDRAVNALIISEMERLRVGDVAEKELVQLASAYKVVREQVTKLDREAAAAAKRLERIAFDLTATGLDQSARQLQEIEDKLRAAGRLGAEEQERLQAARGDLRGQRELLSITEATDELGRSTSTTANEVLVLLARTENLQQRQDIGNGTIEAANRLWGELLTLLGQVSDQAPTTAQRLDELTASARGDFDTERVDIALDAARGLITPEQAEKAAREAGEAFNAEILRIIGELETAGELTPQLKEGLVGQLEDTGKEADSTAAKVANIAKEFEGVLRGVLSVLDAMGVLDDRMRRIVEGGINLGAGIASALSGNIVGGVSQAIGGAISLFSGLFGGSEEERRARIAQIDEMINLQRALERLREAVISDVSQRERAQLLEGLQPIFDVLKVLGIQLDEVQQGSGVTITEISQEALAAIRELERVTGLPIFDAESGRLDLFALSEALDFLQESDLGGFGQDLEGRLDALAFVFSQLGDAIPDEERLRRFIEVLAGFNPALAGAIQARLDTGGPEEARAFINGLVEEFARSGLEGFQISTLFGADADADEVRRILEAAGGFLDGVLGDGASRTNRSVQFASTITEFQANEVIAWLEDIALTARQIRDGLGISGTDFDRPTLDPVVADAVAELAVRDGQIADVLATSSTGLELGDTLTGAQVVNQLTTGDINLGIPDQFLEVLLVEFGDFLRSRNREAF